MKITKSQLKQIIKEELESALMEVKDPGAPPFNYSDELRKVGGDKSKLNPARLQQYRDWYTKKQAFKKSRGAAKSAPAAQPRPAAAPAAQSAAAKPAAQGQGELGALGKETTKYDKTATAENVEKLKETLPSWAVPHPSRPNQWIGYRDPRQGIFTLFTLSGVYDMDVNKAKTQGFGPRDLQSPEAQRRVG